jgi:hypothetical protein
VNTLPQASLCTHFRMRRCAHNSAGVASALQPCTATRCIMPKCPLCKREFRSASHLGPHVKKCQQLAGEAADARAARPTDSPPPMKSRRLRFLPSGSGGPIQRYEDRTNCDVVKAEPRKPSRASPITCTLRQLRVRPQPQAFRLLPKMLRRRRL